MIKDIKADEKVNGLEKPLCQKDFDVEVGGYQDNFIDGVTYRVWSAFEGGTNMEQSLENLMLRKLETGEDMGEVIDEYEEMIKRKNNEAEIGVQSEEENIDFVL